MKEHKGSDDLKKQKTSESIIASISKRLEGKVFKHHKYRKGTPYYFSTQLTIYELDNTVFPSGNIFIKMKLPEKQSFQTILTPIYDSCARFNESFETQTKLYADENNMLQPYVIRCSLRRECHDRVYDKIGVVQFNLSEFADASRNSEIIKIYLTTGDNYSTLKIGVKMKLLKGDPTYFVPIEDSIVGLSFGSQVESGF